MTRFSIFKFACSSSSWVISSVGIVVGQALSDMKRVVLHSCALFSLVVVVVVVEKLKIIVVVAVVELVDGS